MTSQGTSTTAAALRERIIVNFHQVFWQDYQTLLVNEGEEPIYLPASQDFPHHRIFFAKGFWSSALHEVAHWCIAGAKRRQQIDYGYWYAPDGRSPEQQALFEHVEVKPQALEWLFTSAIGQQFFVSFDNLNGQGANPDRFRRAVQQQALAYLADGLPVRAGRFLQQLLKDFGSLEEFVYFWRQVYLDDILPA